MAHPNVCGMMYVKLILGRDETNYQNDFKVI
jgi:hypothetical protein